MRDELVAGLADITRQLMAADAALLEVIEHLVEKVNILQARIQLLEDLHHLEEHKHELQ